MRGYLLTVKNLVRWNSISNSHQMRMLVVSSAVGVMAGLGLTYVKLNLGLPGHKALFWMTPVLVARLLGRCRAGTTAGALAAAFTTFSLGGHLAGGIIGVPLVGAAGIILDAVIGWMENKKIRYGFFMFALVSLSAMAANLTLLSKRMINVVGRTPHSLFGPTGFWYDLLCYACFGLLAGLVASTCALLMDRYRSRKNLSTD